MVELLSMTAWMAVYERTQGTLNPLRLGSSGAESLMPTRRRINKRP